MDKDQRADLVAIMGNTKAVGEMDYVCGWYRKATAYIQNTPIQAAFVSTNSICQGQQAVTLWKPLNKDGIKILFAHRSFVWNSEAKVKAHVHCVIVGFTCANVGQRYIFDGSMRILADNINSYLMNAPDTFVESISKPLCDVPLMRFGSMPRDGGGFVLNAEERNKMLSSEPLSAKWIRPYVGSYEFINSKERWCLWLKGAVPSELKKCPLVLKRVDQVRKFRQSSSAASTRKFAETPTLFCQIAQPETNYIIIPSVSSSRRKYVPIGFMDANVITSNLAFLIPDATLFHFGILTSNVHNAWMRAVAGRLKSDYRYSKDIVYNNFPWPMPTDAQKSKIERTAQAILDARAMYPDCSLADLYDEVTMPPELRKAHQQNDRAVMQAYGFWGKLNTETECVAELMKMYQELTK